jgi:hypothetical protein
MCVMRHDLPSKLFRFKIVKSMLNEDPELKAAILEHLGCSSSIVAENKVFITCACTEMSEADKKLGRMLDGHGCACRVSNVPYGDPVEPSQVVNYLKSQVSVALR